MRNRVWTVGDMFCGSGGTTTGIVNVPGTTVLWAINHDPLAIESHAANHPEITHYTEDICDMDISILKPVDILWMSAECTHLSNAAGGRSRDPDSRMLSDQIYRYVDHCKPKYIIIENVKEFRSWGPLIWKRDKNEQLMRVKSGKRKNEPILAPNPIFKGYYYKRWIYNLKKMGYANYVWKDLNSADYGARTSRTRYYGIFSLKGYPIRFPLQTYHKSAINGYKKWLPVKPLLDLKDEGKSIFGREKPLVESTMNRIAYGLKKFALSEDKFLAYYYGASNVVSKTGDPLNTITTKDRETLVSLEKRQFITQAFHGQEKQSQGLNEPMKTILTKDLKQMITTNFITQYNGQSKAKDIQEPLNALTTHAKEALASVNKNEQFILKYHGSGQKARSTDRPIDAIIPGNKNALTSVNFIASGYTPHKNQKPRVKDVDSPLNTIPCTNKHQIIKVNFISNQNFGTDPAKVKSIDEPIPTITTQDRIQLITVEKREWLSKHFPENIVDFLSEYITDIKMRFLRVDELKVIQGFPKDYILKGNQREQKKYIGNSVVPMMAEKIVKSNINQ